MSKIDHMSVDIHDIVRGVNLYGISSTPVNILKS
jgi:hypothetical protein